MEIDREREKWRRREMVERAREREGQKERTERKKEKARDLL